MLLQRVVALEKLQVERLHPGRVNAMDPAAVEEFRKLEQEKNRLEGEIKTLYEYLTEDGCLADMDRDDNRH